MVSQSDDVTILHLGLGLRLGSDTVDVFLTTASEVEEVVRTVLAMNLDVAARLVRVQNQVILAPAADGENVLVDFDQDGLPPWSGRNELRVRHSGRSQRSVNNVAVEGGEATALNRKISSPKERGAHIDGHRTNGAFHGRLDSNKDTDSPLHSAPADLFEDLVVGWSGGRS